MADANATALKLCTRCGEKKTLDDFGKDAKRSFGRRTWCKPCHAAGNKRWRDKCPEKSHAASASWKKRNPEKRARIIERFKEKHPGYMADAQRRFMKRIPDEIKRRRRLYRQSAYAKLPIRINMRVSRALRNSLGGTKANRKSFALLGFTRDEFIAHMERQFSRGMNWPAFLRGEIHIDHIRPLSQFHFVSTEDEEFKQAWALTNLRPLWAKENVEKNAKRLFLI